jgi:hypothetical protein
MVTGGQYGQIGIAKCIFTVLTGEAIAFHRVYDSGNKRDYLTFIASLSYNQSGLLTFKLSKILVFFSKQTKNESE